MLLLLYGVESLLRCRKLREIKERYLSLRKGQSYLRSFDCSEPHDAHEIVQEILGVSLFAAKKLIVLEDPFSAKDVAQALLECQEGLQVTPHTLVFCQEGEVDSDDALFSFLKIHGKTQEFPSLEGRSLRSWIQAEFLRYGSRPSPEVQDALIGALGNDLWRLSNEILKLTTFKTASALSEHDVASLVEPIASSDIFATVNAIVARNRKRALALLKAHEQRGDSPLYILATLGFQLRSLLAVKEMVERGIPYRSIAKITRLHPYAFKKTYEAAQNFTVPQLKDGFQRIFDIELGLKTGRLEPSGVLSWFVLGK